MNRVSGFTLIEAIIALVVLSMTFTAVWGWFGTAVTSTLRIEQSLAAPELYNQFTAYLELQDLSEQPQGSFNFNGFTIDWSATVERQSTEDKIRRQPAWIVTLYRIDANVYYQGQALTPFATKAVRQKRDPNFVELPNFN